MVATANKSSLKHRISSRFNTLTRAYKAKDLFKPSRHPARSPKRLPSSGNKLFSTLRTASLRMLVKKLPEESSTLTPKPPKKTLRISKLNFGPYLPDDTHSSSHTYSYSGDCLTAYGAETKGNEDIGLGFLDLSLVPLAVLKVDAARNEEDAARLLPTTTLDVTAPDQSLYSQESWVDVTSGWSQGSAAIAIYATDSLLEGLEEALSQSEDWSLDSETTHSITSSAEARNRLNITSSSIDEESFMRMAVSELGW